MTSFIFMVMGKVLCGYSAFSLPPSLLNFSCNLWRITVAVGAFVDTGETRWFSGLQGSGWFKSRMTGKDGITGWVFQVLRSWFSERWAKWWSINFSYGQPQCCWCRVTFQFYIKLKWKKCIESTQNSGLNFKVPQLPHGGLMLWTCIKQEFI